MNMTATNTLSVVFLDHFNRHGGAQEYIIDIANQLYASQKNVFITSSRLNSLANLIRGVPILNLPLFSDNRKIFIAINFFKSFYLFRRFITNNKITIIHCNSIPALLLARLFSTNRQTIFFTCHDCNLTNFKIRLIKLCAEKIICVSETIRKYLEYRNVKQIKKIIYNGFYDYPEMPIQLQKETTTFGMIGRIEKWKGCHLFIEAAKKLSLKYPNQAHFLIIGYSEDQNYISELLASAKDVSNIQFLPFDSNKVQVFSKLDVLINASIENEPFGRTLVEAAIFSLPVIGPSNGGPSEIIQHNKNGLLFSSGNSDDLCNKMEIMLQSKNLQESMGKEGRIRFEEFFKLEKTCSDLINFYNHK
jgi:glycosyltransferase involved in cell wall biosynthesis